MKAIVFLFLLVISTKAFGFSETELEALENSGSKTFSKSPWRIDMGFSFIKNLDVETRHRSFSEVTSLSEVTEKKQKKLCDPSEEGNLCDPSNLYYQPDFTVYYSLARLAEKYFNYSFLKGTELFIGSYFNADLAGGACSNLVDYNSLTGYIKCGLGDISGGWTMPVYKKNSFFSYFNFSTIVWPLSKKSKDATLKTALNGSISTLYFIKKEEKWSWAVSSNHSLAYNHFTKHRSSNYNYNNPLNSGQQLSFIFKQKTNKYLPSNTSLSIGYSFTLDTENTHWYLKETKRKNQFSVSGIDDEKLKNLEDILENKKECPENKIGGVIICGNRYQQLSLGLSSSWKLKKRVYLALSVKWKDVIKQHSPFNEHFDIQDQVMLKSPVSLGLEKWFFTLRTSYSF